MKRCSPVLNTANGVVFGEATLSFQKDCFKTLLARQASSAPELEHIHRPAHIRLTRNHRPSRSIWSVSKPLLLGYFWPMIFHNEDLYAKIDEVYRRLTRGYYQHPTPLSKLVTESRLHFFITY
ncbi:hypothetical protein RB195_023305 [Necator americanus]|uniref:Uncharacterized protein n=1 Tax=Necator americanus TaxID=51031 RepID=A0ABR1EIL7_NECAM